MSVMFDEPSVARTRAMLSAMVGRRVAVVGDAMLDAYVVGEVARISPEAPVPVLNIAREEFMLGGAANVAKCLVALGAEVRLCTVVGDDADGTLFRSEATNLNIDVDGVVVDPLRATTRKTRIVARQQQVIRLDRESCDPIAPAVAKQLLSRVKKAVKWADAIVVSDYAKGVMTEELCQALIACADGKPVVVDPKKLPWDRYRGATLIKPNLSEAQAFDPAAIVDDASAERCATAISKKLASHVLITRGKDGMTLALRQKGSRSRSGDNGRQAVYRFASRPRELIDVTGAGDVVAATLTLALAAGAALPEATWLANVAAGIKVGKFGAAAVTGQEILEAMGTGDAAFERKVMPATRAAELAQRLRKSGKKVVFTNGCFDILHVGHVSYLERSRRLGDALIVGINTDASVRRLKGAGRPVQTEKDRAHIIASLGCVDAVVLFDDDTPLDLIRTVRPDVLAKGADYRTKQNVVGWQDVESWGGHVVLVDLVEGRSTTKLIERAGG